VTSTRPPSPGSGRHSSSDGSFGRSVASAGARGAILVGVAVVIGIVLLLTSDDDDQAFINDDHQLVEAGEAAASGVAPGTSSTDTTGSTLPGETTTTLTPETDASGATVTTAPPTVDRSQITVIVYNAAGINGIAGAQTDELSSLGYATADPDTADTELAETRLYAQPGFEASCENVKVDLQTINAGGVDLAALAVQTVDPATMPVAGFEGLADCIVVIGQDFAAAT
jgi:hypothetical protein